MLFYMYQIFSSLQSPLHFFVHFFFSISRNTFPLSTLYYFGFQKWRGPRAKATAMAMAITVAIAVAIAVVVVVAVITISCRRRRRRHRRHRHRHRCRFLFASLEQ